MKVVLFESKYKYIRSSHFCESLIVVSTLIHTFENDVGSIFHPDLLEVSRCLDPRSSDESESSDIVLRDSGC